MMDMSEPDRSFEDLINEFKKLAEDLVHENELPEKGIVVLSNIGKGKENKGDVISCSVCINEPAYPATKFEMEDENRTQISILTIQAPKTSKWQSWVEFTVDERVVERIPVPEDAISLEQTGAERSQLKKKVRVPIDSTEIVGWVKKVVQWRIENFVSAAAPFGCCDMFVACSDAKRCVHSNRLYSTVCAYRRNLEAGRIFYGKNRNV